MTRIATCACGNLRVTCSGEPAKVSLCHCLACQKRTGSTYGIAAFFKRQDVRVDGPSKSYERQSDRGFPVWLHFCPDCGSTVFWEPQRKPDAIAVGVGSFADPTFPAPTQSVYGEHRHAWVSDPG
ncbi:GFA family protein [Mesorhizobium sp. ZC-5]|uniref:GFA family protein n=1 Tax=Mesorhizobium sp. ZC-5 TaxID=2986066 RepID=UPI0021E9517D|nr:GFA family protein [Mesorhizobium sp. ZC-5]MCV3240156.1 GFA family protein [Mesorhizobium sp. ZC-5]